MILPISVVAGILVGLACGGKVERLANFRLDWYGLLVTAALIQLALGRGLIPGQMMEVVLYVVSMVLVLLTCMKNLGKPGLTIIGLGVLLNLIAIGANGGYMPVHIAREDYWKGTNYRESQVRTHSLSSKETKLGFLGDIIVIKVFSGADVLSLGDLLIGVGTVVTCVSAMRREAFSRITDGVKET